MWRGQQATSRGAMWEGRGSLVYPHIVHRVAPKMLPELWLGAPPWLGRWSSGDMTLGFGYACAYKMTSEACGKAVKCNCGAGKLASPKTP